MQSSDSLSRVLIVDDNRQLVDAVERALCSEFHVSKAFTTAEARQKISHEPPDVVLLDIQLTDGGREGVDLLETFLRDDPTLPVIMVSGHWTLEGERRCRRIGAKDCIDKQDYRHHDDLVRRLQDAAMEGMRARTRRARELRDPWRMIGNSRAMQEIHWKIVRAARDGVISVLILGETGTGKELVARAIHEQGGRVNAPFVPVVVNSLGEGVLESELFGHERGAFTGADRQRSGHFETARGGVLFLDEIGELPLSAQVKLLRFLEDRRFCRLGGNDFLEVDIQLVTATNRNLEEAVRKQEFREDFHQRIGTYTIELPPLRERREDIPLLVGRFLEMFRIDGRTDISQVSPDAMRILCDYDWAEGNIRELRGVIERCIVDVADERDTIDVSDLPSKLTRPRPAPGAMPTSSGSGAGAATGSGVDLDRNMDRVFLEQLLQALRASAWGIGRAAKQLGISRETVPRRSKRIFKRFPELRNEFPELSRRYPADTPV